MKKFVSIAAAVLLIAALSVSVFAAPAGFVESPTASSPTLVSGTEGITVTPYLDRSELSGENKAELEAAYNDIVSNNEGYAAALDKLAQKSGINASRLAVSELFEVTYTAPEGSEAQGKYTITVNAKYLDKFVGLLNRSNGAWTIVDDASVKGSDLTFTADSLGAFAIIVEVGSNAGDNTDDTTSASAPGTPATGDDYTSLWIWGGVAAVSLIAIVAIAVKSKKVKD